MLTQQEQEEIINKIKANDRETRTKFRLIQEAVIDAQGNKKIIETVALKSLPGNWSAKGAKKSPEGELIHKYYSISPTAKKHFSTLKPRKQSLVIWNYLKGLKEFNLMPGESFKGSNGSSFKFKRDPASSQGKVARLSIKIPQSLLDFMDSWSEEIYHSNVLNDFLEFKLPLLLEKLSDNIYTASPREYLEISEMI